jgi:hypothetical protein
MDKVKGTNNPAMHPIRLYLEVDGFVLDSSIQVPRDALGIVVLANGAPYGTFSQMEALGKGLHAYGFATVLFDLLSKKESALSPTADAYLSLSPIMRRRLALALHQIRAREELEDLPLSLVCSAAAASAAVSLAAHDKRPPDALVFCNGRPELFPHDLPWVLSPTLLLVCEQEELLIEANRLACSKIVRASTKIHIIPPGNEAFGAASNEVSAWLLTYASLERNSESA